MWIGTETELKNIVGENGNDMYTKQIQKDKTFSVSVG